MNQTVDPDLLVPRTCTAQDEATGERKSRPLADYRATSAYVLLGDPGAGKTESFILEAAVDDGLYIRARSFATFEPGPALVGKTLFIDGLDEMRAGGADGRTPLDQVRRHLHRLNRPCFRLSCRAADWYGDSDSAALAEVAPDGKIAVLHLDPLSDDGIARLLTHKFGISDPAAFVDQADCHGLADLLRNPQTLRLLVAAVGSETWPDSRAKTYEIACLQLVRELNPEHRSATRVNAPMPDALLDAAGFLCAAHLLAGIAGFALDDDAADDQHALWRELTPPRELPLYEVLASGLFRQDDQAQQRIPVHRSIAEFLGARFLAALIDSQGLPLGRVLALMTGNDGGIVPDLRGLAAWLAVHSRSVRSELIAREPLGIVLYGDVRDFPTDDKRRVLTALKGEAERYPNFRSEDWTAAPFGALATPNMAPVFAELLAAPSRAEADLALLDCALDALRYGPPLHELGTDAARLEALLDHALRDASFPEFIRLSALKILLRDLPRHAARLVAIAREIQAGRVEDKDDQLLGRLLTELFPEFIRPGEVFDFLHPEKQNRLIGHYQTFWVHRLPEDTPDQLLPELIDQFQRYGPALRNALAYHQIERLAGCLLARTLETHGDAVDDMRLYEWLGAGLNEYGHPHIDGEFGQRVAAWLAARPARYKALLLIGASRCVDDENVWSCLFHSASRLYGAEPPSDFVAWCLDRAVAETTIEFKRHFFDEAARTLRRQGGQDWLTLDALETLGAWVTLHPEFQADLEAFSSCSIEDWRRNAAARRREHAQAREQRLSDWRSHFRKHLAAIRDGSAPPKILHDLAQVHLRQFLDIDGETPRERLADLLGDDEELIAAAYAGFRRSLDRADLPSVAEIVGLESQGREHFIRQPCLVGMAELYVADPAAAMRLDDAALRKLLAFRLTWIADKEPEWFVELVKARPELVAEVLVTYALPLLRKGQEHLNGLWELAYDDNYAAVGRFALPDLLKGFPLRAKNKLLSSALDPLLKAALRYLDSSALGAILAARLAQGSMSAAQRVYWLACGLLLEPSKYAAPLAKHIGASKALREPLGAFLRERERRAGWPPDLPESVLALLVELLGPDNPPEHPSGGLYEVSVAMQTADAVRKFIDTLGGKPSAAAALELERLAALPELAPWRKRLHHAAQAQRSARRKAEFRPPNLAQVCRTLAQLQPANPADLAALAYDHLRTLARKIRDGSTNDYRQYWSYGADGKPERPKPENDCRDILLSDLQERLGRLGVEAIKEGHYAEDKRADIRVSCDGFNVPIEIKKDSHADLWRAIREQLIARYTRDPGADGFGIYLAFWFGGGNMPLPQEGKRPRTAVELEERLRATLAAEEGRLIRVCVVDCALPGG